MVGKQEKVMALQADRQQESRTPEAGSAATPKKRWGCIALMVFAFVIWASVAYILWHISINLPPKHQDEEPSVPFELMPRAEGS